MTRTLRVISWLVISLSVVILAHVSVASAQEQHRLIDKERVVLGDVAPNVPAALAALDLGPAPPPGRSRLISYQEIQLKLRSAGIAASALTLPAHGIRVESKAHEYSPAELEAMIQPSVAHALPSGVSLSSLRVSDSRLLSPGVHIGTVRLPEFTPKKGSQKQTATVELIWGGDVVARLPVTIFVVVDAAYLADIVERGTSITLCIVKGPVEVSTLAQTLSGGRVGDVISVRVSVTNKVVNAKIVSAERVELSI